MCSLNSFLKTISLMLISAAFVGGTMASPPEIKPNPAACKAALKEWSAQNTESLTLDQINERMNIMVTCAEEAHHHGHSDKSTLAYLNEFYRIHTELANRTFDFITRHDLKVQFDEEENGAGSQTPPKANGSYQ
jgi:hypothetical protein